MKNPKAKEWTPLEEASMKTGRRMGQIHRAPGTSGRKRFKLRQGACSYHVMSRMAGGDHLFDGVGKEAFVKMMRRMSRFCGVDILTYVVMDNHFHLLVHVPDQKTWLKKFEGEYGEEILLKHLSHLYSKAFLNQLMGEIRLLREKGHENEVQKLLDRFKSRFCDVSVFMKELKERFTRWYNKHYGRRGTLWMDRFKSIAVEDGVALRTMAAYIDLNPVRAGMVADPKDYHWSGYGAAMGGVKEAQRGLRRIVETRTWAKASRIYRCWIYEDGVVMEDELEKKGVMKLSCETKKSRQRRGFSLAEMRAVKERKGSIGGVQSLRTRLNYLSRGIAIGSADFVKGMAKDYGKVFQRTRLKRCQKIDEGTSGEGTSGEGICRA